MKKIILSSIFLISFSIQAQLKIGLNPSSMISGSLFQINGGATAAKPVSDSLGTASYDATTFLFNNGKVGINTLRPDGQLDVVGNGTQDTAIVLANTSGSGITSGHKYVFNSMGSASGIPGSFLLWDATAQSDRMIIRNDGKVGFGTLNPLAKLHVNGGIIAASVQGPSDIRFKKNIVPLQDALSKVTALNGYNYEWRTNEFPDRAFKKGTDMGLIAQEVEKVFPEVVFTASDEMQSKSIDYSKLVPALVESIKELKAEVDLLKVQLAKTKDELASAK